MRNPLTITLILIGLGLYSVVLSTLRGSGELFKYMSLQKNFHSLEMSIANLRLEAEELENEIHRITNSKEYAKKVFRDKYHITNKGESIMFFAD